jgi:hypothetical protein
MLTRAQTATALTVAAVIQKDAAKARTTICYQQKAGRTCLTLAANPAKADCKRPASGNEPWRGGNYRRSSDALSAAGRGIKPDEPAPSEQRPLEPSEPSTPQPPASDEKTEAKPDVASNLKAQLNAMRQPAQQPQQQHYDPLALYLGQIAGLSPAKFMFLHHYFSRFPQNLNPQHWDVLKAAHGIALDRGVREDSPEYFGFLHSLLNQQAAAAPPPQAAPAPPPTHEPEPEPQHTTHIDLEKVETHDSEPEEPPMTHYAAPVSRGSERYAMGDYEPTAGSIRLSAEQRDMAHRSMPHLSADEAEKSYAANLIKMQKMQKGGLIK